MEPAPSPSVRRRRRRGATLVFVAILLVALVGVCGIAIDLSRLYVSVNELQTAVDAAALRGALRLQRAPDSSTGELEVAVSNFWGGSNTVAGGTVTDPAVVLQRCSQGANTVTCGAPGVNAIANAVKVTATLSSELLFGRVLSVVAPRPSRSATAWVASIGRTCIRPFLFDINVIIPSRSANSTDNVTANDLALLRANAMSGTARLTIAPAGETPGNGGNWIGVNGPWGVFANIVNTCNAGALTFPMTLVKAGGAGARSPGRLAENAFFNPGSSGSNANGSQNSPAICASSSSDYCGQTIPVLLGWHTNTGAVTFSNATDFSAQLMITFKVLCFKQQPSRGCVVTPAPANWSGAAIGTMYGYLDTALPTFAGAAALGADASWEQRLILVK